MSEVVDKAYKKKFIRTLIVAASDITRAAIVIHLGHYLHEDSFEQLEHEVKQMLKKDRLSAFGFHLGTLEEAGIIYRKGKIYGLTEMGQKISQKLGEPLDEILSEYLTKTEKKIDKEVTRELAIKLMEEKGLLEGYKKLKKE
jgi:DNA-binding transcriptional ArsR family regulator